MATNRMQRATHAYHVRFSARRTELLSITSAHPTAIDGIEASLHACAMILDSPIRHAP